MKKLILSAFALAALAGSALAQQPPAPPPAGASPENVGQPAPPPPPPAGGPMTRGPDGPRHDPAGPPHDGPREEMGMRGHRPPPPPPPPSKGAHFRIEDGDTTIDLKCAEDEPMKACADLLLQAMDRLQGPAQP